jgi:membrane dipeptidase
MRLLGLALLPLLLAIPASAQQAEDVTPADRAFHESLIVLDTHLDIPERWDDGSWDFGARHRWEWDRSQVDLPRMEEGGLDGGFFAIYTPQGALTDEGYREARDAALVRAMAIRRAFAENRDRIGLALTPDDARRLVREGRRFGFISIENSWPLGEDLSLLETFHKLGVRLASPVHFRNNQFADSATDSPRWHGLSPLGRQWVAEMNRLGILIDVSHASDDVFDQVLELSRVPIILSHSSPRAIFDHPRNLDDARMRRLAAAGGVMFINSVYLAPFDRSPDRAALEERHRNWATLSEAERQQLLADEAALDARVPRIEADFDTFMRAMLHAIEVMGADHVGIGCDWDGGGGLVGMRDITALPRITAALRRAGVSDADIAKIMGGNLLRVLAEAQAAAERR